MTDWTTYSVVRDKDDDLWGAPNSAALSGRWDRIGSAPLKLRAAWSDELETSYGPIAPVLDAGGLPVVRTVGDLTARHIGRRVRVGTEGAEGSLDALDIGRHRFVVYLIGADAVHVLGGLTIDTPCEVLDA